MRAKYRVLLIAETANPEWESVPLEGWSLSQALNEFVDGHIVTHVRNREAFLRAKLVEGRDFTALDNEYVASPLYKISNLLRGGPGVGWTTVMAFSSLAYYAFEYELWKHFREQFRNGEFDLVHRITPISPTSQSLIAKRLKEINVPFIIGPLNGGVPWPKEFVSRQHAENEWLAHIRNVYKLMPYYASTRRCSSALIVGSKHTYEQMPDWAKPKCVYVHENGVDLERFSRPRERMTSQPVKAAFVGRLVPYKGADILIEAAERLIIQGRLTLDFVGDGPQRAMLEDMVDRKALRRGVTFHGWVRHLDVQNILRECDLLALPSVREFGGAVVVEAMALGVTPVVADYAGPSELVDDNTGFRVPFQDKATLVDGFERVLRKIVKSPDILDKMGVAAREKVIKHLTWEAKAQQIVEVYDNVLKAS